MLNKRLLGLLMVLLPIVVLFFYVAISNGPLAKVEVSTQPVKAATIKPAIYGLGTVESRYTHQIGPTMAGRVESVLVDVGDHVSQGQVVAKLQAVDLVSLQVAANAAVSVAAAQVEQAEANMTYSDGQLVRYEKLLQNQTVSEDLVSSKRQLAEVSRAALKAAVQKHHQALSESAAVTARNNDLLLLAPNDGLVTARLADAVTTVVAGQAVITTVDSQQLWVNVRFDQVNAAGLAVGLPATIELRSAPDSVYMGQVLRVEPVADVVTEEMLAKVLFESMPQQLPPIGELAEVTVHLAELPTDKVIPNAAIHQQQGQYGVWQEKSGKAVFVPIEIGQRDLDGQVEVLSGLSVDDEVIVYSQAKLKNNQRLKVVNQVPPNSQ